MAQTEAAMRLDTVRRVDQLHALLRRHGSTIGPRVWPGFRPDTIPTLYVIAYRAKLLAGWRGPLPAGLQPLDGRADAGWAGAEAVALPSDRGIAFARVDSSMTPGDALGLALHEQFHSFEHASVHPGSRFGRGENALLVATYPSFDAENEAAFALEGELLHRALRARTPGQARRRAREFLAVRERRQRRLDSAVVEFERMAEINEGLAQYALLRGLAELARVEGGAWRDEAAAQREREASILDSLLAVGPRSVRRRFYATGSAIALLLDRLAGPTWKRHLARANTTLQDELASAVGFRGEAALGARWTARSDSMLAALTPAARASVDSLRARRRAQMDSVLSGPGLRLVLDPSVLGAGSFQWCGFDPQNTLQVDAGVLLHARMLTVCLPGGRAEFQRPVIERRQSGEMLTMVAVTAALRLTTAAGPLTLPPDGASVEVTSLRLDAPTVTITAARATLTRSGPELRVRPRR